MLWNKLEGRCRDNNHRKRVCDRLAAELWCPETGGQRFMQEAMPKPGPCPGWQRASQGYRAREEEMYFALYHFKEWPAAGCLHLQKISRICTEGSPLCVALNCSTAWAPRKEFEHLSRSSWENFQHLLPEKKDFSGSQDSFQLWQQVSLLKKSICQTKTQTCGFQGTWVYLRGAEASNTIKHWLQQKSRTKELKSVFEK